MRRGRKAAGAELVEAWPSCRRRKSLGTLGLFVCPLSMCRESKKGGHSDQEAHNIFCDGERYRPNGFMDRRLATLAGGEPEIKGVSWNKKLA